MYFALLLLPFAIFVIKLASATPSHSEFSPIKSRNVLDRSDNVVLYWGQGDFGERRLSYYCDQEGVSIVILSFITDFIGGPRKSPIINLADNCNDVENCVETTQDIKYCQGKGVKVLMSVGGAAGSYHKQSWDPDLFAWWLWNKFLGGDDRTVPRPFGDAVLDGIDYDPEETTGKGYDRHIHTLRQLFQTQYPPRQYLITAAPQCSDLDYYPKNAQYNILHPSPQYDAYPDMVFVQFYNNDCSAAAHKPRGFSDFNFDAWNKWAQEATKGRTKVLLGVLGRDNRMDTGYVSYDKLTMILDDIKSRSQFRGVMIWDAGYAYANKVPYFNNLAYGQATAKYLRQLATNSKPGTKLIETIDMALQENQMPIMIPVRHDARLPCKGQPMMLLKTVSTRILAQSFGASPEILAERFETLGVSGDEPLYPGSRICLTVSEGDMVSLGYIYSFEQPTDNKNTLSDYQYYFQ
ncbi:hypothetical protein RMATCC62417_03718 [Rhizopus microsporus]|nr:hypothetical protein RMATCC62417_03718 [Rhizopus microsporus]